MIEKQRYLLTAFAALVALALAAATPFAIRSAFADGNEVMVRAGGGETGYSVEEFLPNDITVNTGDTVTWDFSWFEPHSVTFGTPTGDPTAPSVPLDAPYEFDGSSYFSSGLIAPGFADVTEFSVTFTVAGDYDLYCAIHPFMTATVHVVDSGDVDTQEDLDSRGDAQYADGLAALKAAAAPLAAAPVNSTDNGDGTTTYDVVVSGASLMQGTVMQFFPPSLDVKVGDTVHWDNDTPVPHTVTFNPQDFPPLENPDDVLEFPPTGTPGAFDGTTFLHSGIIGVDFPDGTTFDVTFTTPGTFNYVCVLHADQGMVGVVNVSAAASPTPTAPAPTPTATPTTQAPQPPATGSGVDGGGSGIHFAWYLLGALLVTAGSASVFIAGKRR